MAKGPALSAKEAAKYCGVGRRTLDRMLRDREIHGFRNGARWLFTQEECDEWIAAKMREQVAAGEEAR